MSRVRSYNRKVNGQVFSVKAYSTRRERDQDLDKEDRFRAAKRPPIVAQPGQYPASRKFAKIFFQYHVVKPPHYDPNEIQQQLKEAEQIVTEEGLKVVYGPSDKAQAAIALLRRHGHTVTKLSEGDRKPGQENPSDEDKLDQLKKPSKRKKKDDGEIKQSGDYFIHPKSGETVQVPEGGQVWRHWRFKDSYLVLSADAEPLVLIGKNGKAQKPPTHLKVENFLAQPAKLGRREKIRQEEAQAAHSLAASIRQLQALANKMEKQE